MCLVWYVVVGFGVCFGCFGCFGCMDFFGGGYFWFSWSVGCCGGFVQQVIDEFFDYVVFCLEEIYDVLVVCGCQIVQCVVWVGCDGVGYFFQQWYVVG